MMSGVLSRAFSAESSLLFLFLRLRPRHDAAATYLEKDQEVGGVLARLASSRSGGI